MKNLLKFSGAAFASAALLACAAPASASVFYDLTVDHCSGSGCGLTNYGSIEVSGQGTGTLTFAFDLADNVIFNQAGNRNNLHDAIWFNLDDASTTVAGLPLPFSANALQNAGSHSPNGASFGTFDYLISAFGGNGVDRNGQPTTAAGGMNTLTFTVTGASPVLVGEPFAPRPLYFVVDVAAFGANNTVLTGNIGAVLRESQTAVPEPATWSLMILGFGGVGALLRKRRTQVRPILA